MTIRIVLLHVGLVGVLLIPCAAPAADDSAGPAYQIVLRSRHAQASPGITKQAQTGGGWIAVAQPEPNTVTVTMGGSAVVGSGFHPSVAGVNFELIQDLEIVPTRANVRPPRVGMIGRVVGTLQVSDPVKFAHADGSAQQGSAAACLALAGTNLLCLDVEPSTAACGNDLSINHQTGPVETPVVASSADTGCYRLTASFGVSANQGKGVCHRHYAVADFDPAPQLDGRWADALRPFRAVPRNDFGFTLIIRVVEDAAQITPPSANSSFLPPPLGAHPFDAAGNSVALINRASN